ncbi:uncharacterized protein LOC135145912 [Zophobas morio]|uniref:uncharacterized protein LOC135145912 n=1 Tax=Zophobas morio TaxID=2755281 RepID=UPI003082E17C
MTDTSLFFGAAPVIISEIIRSEADLMRGIGDLKKISSYEECLSVNDKLKKNLQFLYENINKLESASQEQFTRTHKDHILKLAEQHRQQLKSLQLTLRHTYAYVKEKIERESNMKRLSLLGCVSGETTSIGNMNKNVSLSSVESTTELMREARRNLAGQIQQSAQALDAAVSSSNLTTSINKEYSEFRSVMRFSKALVSKLLRRETTNNILFAFAFVVFALTCIYILKKRLAYIRSAVANVLELCTCKFTILIVIMVATILLSWVWAFFIKKRKMKK